MGLPRLSVSGSSRLRSRVRSPGWGQDVGAQQVAYSEADLGILLARLRDGNVVLVLGHGSSPDAGLCRSLADDQERPATHSSRLVVGGRLDAEQDSVLAIPVVQIDEVRIVGAQLFDGHRRAED